MSLLCACGQGRNLAEYVHHSPGLLASVNYSVSPYIACTMQLVGELTYAIQHDYHTSPTMIDFFFCYLSIFQPFDLAREHECPR